MFPTKEMHGGYETYQPEIMITVHVADENMTDLIDLDPGLA